MVKKIKVAAMAFITAFGVMTATGCEMMNTNKGNGSTSVRSSQKSENSNGSSDNFSKNGVSDDSLFDYYNLLDSEYKKCGKVYPLELGHNDTCFAVNEKIVVDASFSSFEKDRVRKTITYDANKKAVLWEFDPIKMYDTLYADIGDGFIYSKISENSSTYDFTYIKYDLYGNLLLKKEFVNENFLRIFADGTLFTSENSGAICMYSDDWQNKTVLPSLEVDGLHGTQKKIRYEICTKYDNKVWVRSEEGEVFCLNTVTNEWKKLDRKLTFAGAIGKYWFTNSYEGIIYDLETDEIIAENCLSNFYDRYKGGTSGELLMIFNDDRTMASLYRYKVACDGSKYRNTHIKDFDNLDDFTNNGSYYDYNEVISFINEQYYLYHDKYGYFLREYGKGEEGEITVYMF